MDNSLTAGARDISVTVEPSAPAPHIVVLDNGRGMSEDRLVEAMRMGTLGPLAGRAPEDLGRFGLGLKTASLSAGRCVTVITRQPGAPAPSIRRWDVRHIRSVRKWELLREPTDVASRYVLSPGREGGTAVVIEDLDRVGFLDVSPQARESHLADALSDLATHLGMVFHRFIEDGVVIRLGATPVKPWDPFMQGKSFALPVDTVRYLTADIPVAPFVLPHHSQLTDAEYDAAARISGWGAHQGFYIYRCGRLIVPGTWLNLGLRKDDQYKLARIRVDLPNTLDAEWKLNVMKSHVAAPPALRDTFKRIAQSVRHDAAAVFRHRGEREVTIQGGLPHAVWKREDGKRKVRFRVDRTHPVVYALLNSGCSHARPLADALSIVEQALPIDSILQVPSRSLDGSVAPEDRLDLEALAGVARATEEFYVRTGMSRAEARNRVLSVDPIVRYRQEILARLEAQDRTPGSTPA